MANKKTYKKSQLNTYLIERNIPEAGKLSKDQLQGISEKSCNVLKTMGSGIEWIHSYVAENKVYCIYKAENEELILRHAKEGGFPADKITIVSNVIDPGTAKEK
ncbi:MAG: DUF4242 domain-containing protein [Saprospiraceae bacterium]|nr:DUF4242 domain-containing protein [Saprospiraceae bacterium]